jgi:uncharacterized protein
LFAWIERHILIAFFGLTYAISWGIWWLEPTLQSVNPVFARSIDTLAPYGPLFAAVLLSAWLKPERLPASYSWPRILATVSLVLAAAWVLADPWAEVSRGQQPVLTSTALALITLLPGWVVWCAWSQRRGIRDLLAPLVAWRIPWVWYLTGLLLFPLASLAGLLWLPVFSQSIPAFPRTEAMPGLIVLLLNVFVATALYGGPLGEEAGWRGFALPRLQARYSPLVASVILGLLWGLWHFPLHFRGMYDESFGVGVAAGLLLRVANNVLLAIVFTWLYNRSRGNLLIMVLLHTAINNTFGFWLPVHAGIPVVMIIITLLVVYRGKLAPVPTLVR